MIKMIALLKRKPGMSMADFIAHYESTHARIADKYLRGRALHYSRKFLHGIIDPLSGQTAEPEYDVVTEVWFADQAAFETAMALLSSPAVSAEIVADEENLFDRPRNRFCMVEEYESDVTPTRQKN